MHLLRGNIGAGMFGMGDAYRNGGIIFSPIVTVCIALICVHNQHILVRESLVSYPRQNHSTYNQISQF